LKKIALFAFNGDPLCFIHVLLNALDLKERGFDPRLIIEGAATKLIPEISRQDSPLFSLYNKVKEQDLIEGACKACSNKMGVLEQVKSEDIKLLGEMTGHPSMGRFLGQGYEIITF
jgi:hypothetical protein